LAGDIVLSAAIGRIDGVSVLVWPGNKLRLENKRITSLDFHGQLFA